MPLQNKGRMEYPQQRRVYRYFLRERAESWAEKLAPSEAVLLNGDQFATPVPRHIARLREVPKGTTLLHLDTEVSRTELLVVAFSVALLARERNGEVTLAVKKENSSFLRQERWKIKVVREDSLSLIVKRGSALGQWPQGSLEARIGRALAERSTTLFTFWTDHTVAHLIGVMVNGTFWESFFTSRHAEPYLLSKMAEALIARGMADLIPGDGKLLGIFPYQRASAQLSETGQRAVAQYDLEEVWQLLSRCKQDRPKVWSLLQDEIESGLARADSANRGD